MKKIFSIVLLMPLFVCAQEGIRFEESLSWSQVLQKAKKENKYIFVDCYATWCGPCKYMDKNIYPNDTVGSFFNEKFISVKIQMDTSKDDNEFVMGWYANAAMIKSKYKVSAFPTFLFFSPNGYAVHRNTGSTGKDYFISLGADALSSDKQYYTLLEKYQRNELDTAYMKYFARLVNRVEGKEFASKIANDYINRVSIETLFTKDNIQLMYEFTKSSKDRGFKIFKDQRKRISETDERVSETVCKSFVLNIINKEEIKPYTTTKQGKPDWKRIKSNLKKYGSLGEEAFTQNRPGILFKSEIEPALKINAEWGRILPLIEKLKLGKNAEFVVGSSVVYYLNAISVDHKEKDRKNFIAAATYYADSFPTFLSANALNDWAWKLFEKSNDKDELRKALEWSNRSNELDPNDPFFLDTYANLLYKLGHIPEAIQLQEKAAAMAKNHKGIQENLSKMKKGQKTWSE